MRGHRSADESHRPATLAETLTRLVNAPVPPVSVNPPPNPLASPPRLSSRWWPYRPPRGEPLSTPSGPEGSSGRSGFGRRGAAGTPPPSTSRRGVRAAEGARLESVYGLIAHRGFESLPLRQRYYISIGNAEHVRDRLTRVNGWGAWKQKREVLRVGAPLNHRGKGGGGTTAIETPRSPDHPCDPSSWGSAVSQVNAELASCGPHRITALGSPAMWEPYSRSSVPHRTT